MKHRLLIIGAGRIGAGYNWNDDAYTHAGAAMALSDRVELVGFVEPELDRAQAAAVKWNLPVYADVPTALAAQDPDIVSVCVQPDKQREVLEILAAYKPAAVWCEKPYMGDRPYLFPIQVNYMRRGDPRHQEIATKDNTQATLYVYAKDDIHTRCHFEDLAKWWNVQMEYMAIQNGPCTYTIGDSVFGFQAFPYGGVDGGTCFRAMLKNMLDHVDNGTPLWSPVQ